LDRSAIVGEVFSRELAMNRRIIIAAKASAVMLACAAISAPDRLAAAVTAPEAGTRGAYVTQIGDEHRATVIQDNPGMLAIVHQQGARNDATLIQSGVGRQLASLRQLGEDNFAMVAQDGLAASHLVLLQQGVGNSARAVQSSTLLGNTAAMTQIGSGNDMSLVQEGDGNDASLLQAGDDNRMAATQNGSGNMLTWMQYGHGLSQLDVTQGGGQTMLITQTR